MCTNTALPIYPVLMSFYLYLLSQQSNMHNNNNTYLLIIARPNSYHNNSEFHNAMFLEMQCYYTTLTTQVTHSINPKKIVKVL